MSRPRVHLICNAHLDPMWLWEWEEGAAEAVSTFRTAADLCDEFPGFIFCHNEVVLYKWVEEYEPSLFARIQDLVRQGKWHIMGGWYVQPDCNMPSGESFARQALIGKRYFAEKFGVEPTVGINLDPFGHTRGLAQILARAGYDSYLFCRPGQGDCPLPADNFAWVGYDGSRISASRMPGYNSPLGNARGKVTGWMEHHPEEECLLVLWGVGNHGGGPSRGDLRDLAALMRDTESHEIIHSTPASWFADLRATHPDLPEHAGDLNPWAVGCYTSQVRLKQKHRLLENELYMTEKMLSACLLQGVLPWPGAELHEAACDLATAQFHDILPGSSIQPVEEASLRMMDHALETVARLKTRAFFALAAGQPKARESQIPVLVYNPHPFPVRTVVECEFQLPDQNWAETFTNPRVFQAGKPLPSQVEKEHANLPLDWRKRVAFLAELKPSSMNRFDCRLEVLPEKPSQPLELSPEAVVFETPEMRVVVNRATGLVDSYQAGGVEQVGACAFQPIVMADNEDPWGMLVRSYRKVAGRFHLATPRQAARIAGVKGQELDPVRVVENGDARTVVEALFAWGESFICQRYLLPRVGTEIQVETRVHWNEKDKLLKLSIPVPQGKARYVGQVAFGRQELPANGDEAVAQQWVAVVDDGADRCLTCINEGSYGSDFSADGLRLTLLRSPAYSGHPIGDRTIVPQDRYTPRIDQGERLFRFWLNAGPAAKRLAVVDREALSHNEKPMALSFFPSGQGAALKPLVTLSDSTVIISAVKQGADGRDLVVRLFEPTGTARSTTLSVGPLGLKAKLKLGAFQIMTLRINTADGTWGEVDLLER
jgi:alpha-mannosidase